MYDNEKQSELSSEKTEPEKAEETPQTTKQMPETKVEECTDGNKTSQPCTKSVKKRIRRSATMSKEVKLSLTFRTTDAMRMFTTKALLDCGATDSFIDKGAIEKYGLTVTKLSDPIPIYNANGGRNKLGDIDGYVELEMIFGNHKELMTLYATSLGKDSIFIGHDWLKKHNPDIDWTTGEVNMTRCPKTCGYKH